ncbi:MAG: DUF2752 domain-containing protein [Lacipirellulaceae bacterium]
MGDKPTKSEGEDRLPGRLRLALFALALLLAALLVMASRLAPDPRGFGTHEQLGLSPCWIHQRTGITCPSCGMTTAWAHALAGQILPAIQSNLGGTLLCVVALVVAPWLALSAIVGRWLLWRPSLKPTVIVATAILTVTVLDWLRRVFL